MRKIIICLLEFVIITSCSPIYTTSINQGIPWSSVDESIKVFGLNSEIPVDAEVLGTIKVGDSGFTATKNCTFQDVLSIARIEAKRVGGNAIKITDHIPPGNSTCHRITAKILRLNNSKIKSYQEINLPNSNIAILNIYCQSSLKSNYDLHLGDSIICSVNNNLKTSVAIRENGLKTIWAQADKKTEIQIDIEFGRTYYLKCDLILQDSIRQPSIELIDPNVGSRIFNIF